MSAEVGALQQWPRGAKHHNAGKRKYKRGQQGDKQTEEKLCLRCNRCHRPRKCPTYNKQCRKCSKLGHFPAKARLWELYMCNTEKMMTVRHTFLTALRKMIQRFGQIPLDYSSSMLTTFITQKADFVSRDFLLGSHRFLRSSRGKWPSCWRDMRAVWWSWMILWCMAEIKRHMIRIWRQFCRQSRSLD